MSPERYNLETTYISDQEPLTNFRRDLAAEGEYWWRADLLARRIRRRGMIQVAWIARRIRRELRP